MRVLHVIPSVAPRYGGPSYAVQGMCRALGEAGVETLIATTDADGPTRLHVLLGEVSDYEGLPAVFFARQWTESFKYSRPLARWLDSHVVGFDVVHVHAVFSHSSLAAAWACQRQDVPYIVRPLGSLDPWSMAQGRLKKQTLWYAGIHRMLRRAAAIHYTSDEERHLAEASLGLRRGVVVPLGVDDTLLHGLEWVWPSRTSLPTPYVLTLARLHPKKGLDLLIEAFARVVDGGDALDYNLVIAGDGEPHYKARLRALASSYGLDSRVVFTGWLAGDTKIAALRNAMLFALPSYQENFALSVAEAMACGVPVLVSPSVNLAGEIHRSGAGWVAELDPGSIACALQEALVDSGERQRRGAAARSLTRERFSWPVVAEQLAGLYRSIQ